MKILLLALTLLTLTFCKAQTTVGGTISSNTVWNASGNPYIVTGNIYINENVTLTINPGVIVKFNKDFDRYDIWVDGTLRAVGTDDSVITFTSNASNPGSEDWGGIKFETTAEDYDFTNQAGCILQYCSFEYGSDVDLGAGSAFIKMINSTSYIDHCIFTNITTLGGVIGVGADSTELRVTNNKFLSSGSTMVPVIFEYNVSSGDISCNLFYNSQGNGCSMTGNCNFHNNLIIGGDGLAMDVSATDRAYNNTIVDNKVVDLMFSNYGIVDHNTITRNELSKSSTLPPSVSRLFDSTAKFKANNIYGQTLGEYTYSFYDAETYAYHPANFSTPIDATGNWFNETSPLEISYLIHDYYDDTTLYVINYEPFLLSPDIDAPITPPTGVNKIDLGGNNVQVSWNPNPDADVAGYKIYWGHPTGYSFTNSVDAGNVTSYTLTNINFPDTVAVTAYDVDATGSQDQCAGHESWFTYDYMFTGIHEISSAQKNNLCYPNPADQYTMVDVSGVGPKARVIISTAIGKIVKVIDLKSSRIAVDDLPCGMYSIDIYNDERKIGYSKLVIVR